MFIATRLSLRLIPIIRGSNEMSRLERYLTVGRYANSVNKPRHRNGRATPAESCLQMIVFVSLVPGANLPVCQTQYDPARPAPSHCLNAFQLCEFQSNYANAPINKGWPADSIVYYRDTYLSFPAPMPTIGTPASRR